MDENILFTENTTGSRCMAAGSIIYFTKEVITRVHTWLLPSAAVTLYCCGFVKSPK
jgi:hypothetical protein